MLLDLIRYGTSVLVIKRADGGNISADLLRKIQMVPGVDYVDRQYAGEGIRLVWGSPQADEEENQIRETVRQLHEDLVDMGHKPVLFNHCETIDEWLAS